MPAVAFSKPGAGWHESCARRTTGLSIAKLERFRRSSEHEVYRVALLFLVHRCAPPRLGELLQCRH